MSPENIIPKQKNQKTKMEKKGNYVAPVVKTVEIETQTNLLEDSTQTSNCKANVEKGTLNGFEDDWE